jgi:signal transduction histidine kinase
MRLTSRFLRRYQTDSQAAARLERVLAIGRAFLTVTAFVTIYLDPTEPARFTTATYSVLLAYAAYSGLVLAWMHTGGFKLRPIHSRLLHAGDVVWASAMIFLGVSGPVSPFFLFFPFAVAASAYRWGFRETVATAAATIAIFMVKVGVARWSPWHEWFLPDGELNRSFLRVAYLILTGFLFGYLAEQDKQSRAELAAIADLPRQSRLDSGLRGLVTAMASSLLRTFDARSVAIVLEEQDGDTSLWRLVREHEHLHASAADRLELTEAQQALWLFDAPAPAWHAKVPAAGNATTFWIAERGAWPLRRLPAALPFTLTSPTESGSLTAVDLGMTPEWRGRIYLFDAAYESPERVVHFLEAVGEHITPALTNVFLHRRLQSQESAAERARVARELHDGVIQSLYGIEMKLEALRRRQTLAEDDQRELSEVRDLVRVEAMAIRELMQALRPVELDAREQLADVLVAIVERFRRDSGISARFVAEGGVLALPPASALEIVRIVQESLVNVRKHSRATNVLVKLTQTGTSHRLTIEDDGCGFGFEGRLSAPELDARRTGPAIIKERARILGASLAVESAPGSGARIELTLAGSGQR